MSCLNNNFDNIKLDLNYPINWSYKVIGRDEKKIKDAIKSILHKKEYKITLSNTSKKGKFSSFHLMVLVDNEDERVEIYKMLCSCDDIIRVI